MRLLKSVVPTSFLCPSFPLSEHAMGHLIDPGVASVGLNELEARER